jgi:hypothetical protein
MITLVQSTNTLRLVEWGVAGLKSLGDVGIRKAACMKLGGYIKMESTLVSCKFFFIIVYGSGLELRIWISS